MKRAFLITSASILMAVPAQAQFLGGLDNTTVLAGAAGAGIGAGVGAAIAPGGNNTEGIAIGALVGGLGGAAIGNRYSTYPRNPYAGTFNPGFTGTNLLGTAAGAGIGGVIGSNIAGSGVREEGTAIGALIGGVAGYAISNRASRSRGYRGPAYRGQAYRQPAYAPPAYRGGFNTFGYAAPRVLAPVQAVPTYQFGGYVPGPVIAQAQRYTVQRAPIAVAAPTVRLAPAPAFNAPRAAEPIYCFGNTRVDSRGRRC